MHAGDGGAHGPDQVGVEGDGQLRVDPALHAHLRRARLGRLHRPRGHLVQREPERVGVALALRERAEAATDVADVREVDVAVDHVGDLVADDVAAQVVGRPRQLLERGAVGEDQRHGRVRVRGVEQRRGVGRREASPARTSPPSRCGARADRLGGQLVAQRVPVAVHRREVATAVVRAAGGVDRRVEIDAARGGEAPVRFLPRPAHRDGALPGETGAGIGERRHVPVQPGVDPRRARQDVARVGGEPLAQREPDLGRARRQLVDRRPGALGVHVVRRHRRDAAPVVDPGAEHERELVADEVRRGLQPHLRAEHQPGDGDRGGEVVEIGVRVVRHRGVRLRPEVLDDRLLHVPVRAGGGPDREQRLGPLDPRLPDPDEDAGGERDADPPGVGERPQPDGGLLVRAAVVRPALLRPQPGGRGLQHHPHAGRDGLEPRELLPAHDARVEVRQQARLLQHGDRARAHVLERGVVAAGLQPLAGRRPALLRPVAEGEQRLLAPCRGSGAGDLQHLVALEERRGQAVRHGGERAVVAAVAAQPRERHEHLAGVGDDARTAGVGQPRVADAGRGAEQLVELLAAGRQQDGRLGDVERHAVADPTQGPPQSRRRGGRRGGHRRGRRGGSDWRIGHDCTLCRRTDSSP